jgi:hypothetical protein
MNIFEKFNQEMIFHKIMNNKIIISFFLTFFLIYFVINASISSNSIFRLSLFNGNNKIDLSLPLEPVEEYKNIDCVQTIDINSITVTICLYSINDIVSDKLRTFRIYEEKNLSNLHFMNYISNF